MQEMVEVMRTYVALHSVHDNFVRIYRSLRVTPLMAARVADRLWDPSALVQLEN